MSPYGLIVTPKFRGLTSLQLLFKETLNMKYNNTQIIALNNIANLKHKLDIS